MSSFAVALVAVGGFVCLYRSQGDPDVATGTRSANASPAALQHAAIVRTRARRSTNGGRIKEAVGGGGGGGGGRAAAALVVLVLLLLIVIVGPITLYMHNIDMPIHQCLRCCSPGSCAESTGSHAKVFACVENMRIYSLRLVGGQRGGCSWAPPNITRFSSHAGCWPHPNPCPRFNISESSAAA